MGEIKYKPIGTIHSPFKEPKGTPIQPTAAKGVDGMPLLILNPMFLKLM